MVRHEHDYELVLIDAHTHDRTSKGMLHYYHVGSRCKVCGLLARVVSKECGYKPPKGMPLYDVGNLQTLITLRRLPEEMEVRR